MDITTASIFSVYALMAYGIVLWIQYAAWKEFNLHKLKVDAELRDLSAEINSLKKLAVIGSSETKKILVDQKSLYSIK